MKIPYFYIIQVFFKEKNKKKKKMVGILVYAKLMIILQICHRVIFVLKNKIYNIKYSDFKGCMRFFLKIEILAMFTKFYEE